MHYVLSVPSFAATAAADDDGDDDDEKDDGSDDDEDDDKVGGEEAASSCLLDGRAGNYHALWPRLRLCSHLSGRKLVPFLSNQRENRTGVRERTYLYFLRLVVIRKVESPLIVVTLPPRHIQSHLIWVSFLVEQPLPIILAE